MTLTPEDRAAWLTRFRRGFAARPGVNPGQPFQPGSVTGGGSAPTVVVATTAELIAAMQDPAPTWVVVLPSAGGRLRQRLDIRHGNKTIIAPDTVAFTGNGIRLDKVMNVAIAGVSIQDSGEDGFEISSSRVVSILDCAVSGWSDGGIDIVRGSTDVHIGNVLVAGGGRGKAKKGMLIGGDDVPFSRAFTGDHAHLGALDDRHTRVSLEGCVFQNVQVRCPLVRHGLVTLDRHQIIGGGSGPLIEARTNGRIIWRSGRVDRINSRPVVVASYRSQDTVTPGQLFVSVIVETGGTQVAANWNGQ